MNKPIKEKCACGACYVDGQLADGQASWWDKSCLNSLLQAWRYCPQCGCRLADNGFAYPMVRAEEKAEVEKELAASRQRLQMQTLFPQMMYSQRNGLHIWSGTLQPTKTSVQYAVQVQWQTDESPKVFVVYPLPVADAPHRYDDGSLCLYDPREQPWQATDLLADKILPWAAEWLYWYEVWQETGEWMDEAHAKIKEEADGQAAE